MTTVFQRGLSDTIAHKTKQWLNQQADLLSEYTVNSTIHFEHLKAFWEAK
jgi:hypothetical protein